MGGRINHSRAALFVTFMAMIAPFLDDDVVVTSLGQELVVKLRLDSFCDYFGLSSNW